MVQRVREWDNDFRENIIPIWRLNSPLAPSHSPRLLTDRRHRAARSPRVYTHGAVLLAVIYIGTAAVTDSREAYIYVYIYSYNNIDVPMYNIYIIC